jgi:hypothetical protein
MNDLDLNWAKTLGDDLETALLALQDRIKAVEDVQRIFLAPIADEPISRHDVETALKHCGWSGTDQENFWHSSARSGITLPRWNQDQAVLRRTFLLIAATANKTPVRLFDELWPDRRDVVTRLGEVADD